MTDTITVGGTAHRAELRHAHARPRCRRTARWSPTTSTTFLDASIGGGAITAYDISGSPVNIQLRWAKIDSALYGGTDTWNLFYQMNSNATGTEVAWQNAGINYTFGANGQMNPLVATRARSPT